MRRKRQTANELTRGLIALAFAALAGMNCIAQGRPVLKMSDMIKKIEMKDLVRLPVGITLVLRATTSAQITSPRPIKTEV